MENPSPYSMSDIMAMARTPAGKELLAHLQRQNSGQLQKAMACAASGDYQNAQAALSHLLSDPEVRALLKKLGG